MKPVRIGLVGCGAIAQVMHLPGIQTMAEQGKVEIVAVADVFAEKAAETAAKYGIPAHFGDLEKMLRDAEFDLLVNLTPIPDHFMVSLTALRAGRHVYTQKPMSLTLDEATLLIDEARERKLLLGCAPEHPVRPMIQKIRSLIEEGTIGRVTFARVISSHGGPEKHDVPRDSTWFYQAGSSPILDLGVHGLSQITAILGPVRRLACFSGRTQDERITTAGAYAGKRISVNIDDNSLLMLDFGDATYAIQDSSYCVDATLSPRLEIHGSEGTLTVVGRAMTTSTLQLYQTKDKEWREVAVPPAPPVRDLGTLHVVDALREGTPLILTGERGRHLLDVMTKAPLAAKEGRTVETETTF